MDGKAPREMQCRSIILRVCKFTMPLRDFPVELGLVFPAMKLVTLSRKFKSKYWHVQLKTEHCGPRSHAYFHTQYIHLRVTTYMDLRFDTTRWIPMSKSNNNCCQSIIDNSALSMDLQFCNLKVSDIIT